MEKNASWTDCPTDQYQSTARRLGTIEDGNYMVKQNCDFRHICSSYLGPLEYTKALSKFDALPSLQYLQANWIKHYRFMEKVTEKHYS